jgi:serine/threonine protein kinase
MRKTRKKVFKGGKVIASGGFGCVFRPALKCKDSKYNEDGYISKLMLNKYAEREFKLIKQAHDSVKNIPNFKRYFLVYDYNMCQPSFLSSNDLIDYDLKCKDTLPDSSNYINKNLINYKIINSPDGGIDLSYWLDNKFGKYASNTENFADLLWNINTSLVNLLNNGIFKLKDFSYYHMDIKAQNILVKENGLSSKLIDYGLAFKHNASKVPDELKNRALLFNSPFSILLFQKPFIEILLNKVNKTFNIDNNKYLIDDSYGRKVLLQPIVLESMKEFISDINSGHWKYLQYFYKDLFEMLFEENEDGEAISHFNEQLSSDYYRFKFISEYITEACNKFINWKSTTITFNQELLWDKVFKYNVDTFGFLTIYQNIISSSNLTKYGYKSITGSLSGWKNISLFQKRVIEILGEYLLNPEYAIKPFPESKLIEDLRELGEILSSATSNPSQFKKSPIWTENYSQLKNKNKTSIKTRKIYKAGKNKIFYKKS